MFPDNRTGCQTYTIPFTVVLGKNLYILNHVEHINALPVRPSGLLVKFNDCKMQITDCRFQRLRTLSNGRRMSNVGFRITDYGLRITDNGLRITVCGLWWATRKAIIVGNHDLDNSLSNSEPYP